MTTLFERGKNDPEFLNHHRELLLWFLETGHSPEKLRQLLIGDGFPAVWVDAVIAAGRRLKQD